MKPAIPTTVTYRETILPFNIEKIEEKYNATFVGDFCLRTKDGSWGNEPAAVFWQENPPVKEYSNYFALFVRYRGETPVVYITDGASGVAEPIQGIVTTDGEVLYSRYRHDCRSSKSGNVFIDGGRDYVRMGGDFGSCVPVVLTVDGPTIHITELKD